MAKEKIDLGLKTVTNGYVLKVYGQEYMYYNEVDLLAGFLTHVGMGETSPMEKGTILSSLFAAMMGSAYADAVTTLKQRVGLLTSQYNTTIERMDKAIDYVTQAEKQIDGLMSRIKATEDALKATESLHAENKKDVGDTNTRLSMIESRVDELNKHAEEVMNKLVNILTTYQAIEAAKEEKDGKKDAKEGEDKPSKSKKSAGDDKKKSANSRKERDKAILEKAAKNKNIK